MRIAMNLALAGLLAACNGGSNGGTSGGSGTTGTGCATAGYFACDAGCTNLGTDALNCGICDNVCGAGLRCIDSMCCSNICNGFCCAAGEGCVGGCCPIAKQCGGYCCTATQTCDAGACQ